MNFMTSYQHGFASLDDVADAVAAYGDTRRRTRNPEGLRKNVRLRDDGRRYWHWDPSILRTGDQPDLDVQSDEIRSAAMRTTLPSLLVRGLKSDIVSAEGALDMLSLMPTARLVEVDAGHMVAGDDNDVFVAELKGFVDTLL